MENASKALIIAGAILLSILIISLGIMVYNQAQDTVGSASLDQQEIAAFNSQFTPYQGTSITSSQVDALIQQVISVNQAESSKGTGIKVTIKYPPANAPSSTATLSGTTAPVSGSTTYMTTVTSGHTYKVTFSYTNSLVSEINVQDNNATDDDDSDAT